MRRRLVIALLIAAALLSAGLSLLTLSPFGTSASATEPAKVAVISPQRVPGVLAAISSDNSLRADVSSALANAKIGGQTCVAVSRGGRAVATMNDAQALVPASTLKLLTATAAISLYSSSFSFTTSVMSNGINNGVVNGPLYLVGGGDPLLFTADYAKALNRTPDVHTALETLADSVVKAGVKIVHGSVVGDDSRFDKQRYLSSWEPAYQQQGQIGPTGALQLNQGFGRFIGGRVAAPDPTLQAANAFTELLRQRGVKIDDGAAVGNAPAKSTSVASIGSPSVGAIVAEMLTESDNSTAEMMLRNIGVKASGVGSFAAGATAEKAIAFKQGISLNGATVVDGSGLDRSDRLTCSALVAALVQDGPNGAIAAGLPKAGQTGTLTDRMTGTAAVGRVVAKTGTLSNVSALAGWAKPDKGDPIAFAIINNGATSDAGRGFEDGLAETFAALPATLDSVAYAPGIN